MRKIVITLAMLMGGVGILAGGSMQAEAKSVPYQCSKVIKNPADRSIPCQVPKFRRSVPAFR